MKAYNTTRTDLGTLADEREIEGTIVHRNDPAWDAARQAWNLAVDQRPALVTFPETSADVQALVRMADRAGLRIVTQGTGHGATAYGDMSDVMLVRTTRMQHLSIDGHSCRVGAGVLWGDVSVEAGRRGLAGLAGSSPDVGVVGYTLGGGIGWLARRHGLATGKVRSIEIVLADGAVHHVDAGHDPELFWALRGGGGGVGIVTRVEFDLVPLESVYAGTLAWPARHAPALLEAWGEWTIALDERVTSIIRFLDLPPIPEIPEVFRGRRMLTLGAVGVEDIPSAAASLDFMRRVVPPELDTFDRVSPSELVRLHGDPEGPTPGMSHHALLSTFDEDVAARLDDAAAAAAGSPIVSVEVRQLGGAVSRRDPAGGALDHIAAPYVLNAVAMVTDPANQQPQWNALSEMVDALAAWHAGSYLNFSERSGRNVFDVETVRRLADVKRRVDPGNRFAVRSDIPTTAER